MKTLKFKKRNLLYVLLNICIFLIVGWFDYCMITANIDGFKHGFDDVFLTVFIPLMSLIILIIQVAAIKNIVANNGVRTPKNKIT
jgi:hypothetical protein